MAPHPLRSCGLALLAALGAFSGCSEPPVTAVAVAAPSGATAYAIGCEKTPRYCKDRARELCPFGETTLEPGVGGWYADGEDYRHGRATAARDKPNYKLENWVVRCNAPLGR